MVNLMSSAKSLSAENKARARAYLEAIEDHTDGHIDQLEAFVAEDVVNHNSLSSSDATAGEERGLEAFRRHAESVPRAFPDVRFDVQDLIAEDDRVMVRLVLSGTHEGPFMGIDPTGESVSMSGIVIYRFEDGKIVERWGEGNTLGLLQQLGVSELPVPASE